MIEKQKEIYLDFLSCVIMISLGLAFGPEKDQNIRHTKPGYTKDIVSEETG